MQIKEMKRQATQELAHKIKESDGFVAVDYRGISVAEITELRKSLAPLGASMKVVKNSILRHALKEAGFTDGDFEAFLVEPTALVFVGSELGAAIKLVSAEVREGFSLRIKGSLIEGAFYNSEQVVVLSKLPSREQLIAQLMATLNAPVQQVATALQAVPQGLVRVLDAAKDKL